MNVHTGWYLAAFLSDLEPGDAVVPADIGSRRLVLVRTADGVRVFDGTCPHRGAHLGFGGQVDGACLVCPFHGKRIALGDQRAHWAVQEYPTLVWGEAVFVRLGGDEDDRGFAKAVADLGDTHPLVPALTRTIAAPADLVVENAFDLDHFTALHKVHKVVGMDVEVGASGELSIEGEFPMVNSPWQSEQAKAEARYRAVMTGKVEWTYRPRFFARAFSPGVVVTEFGPPDEVHVIVTAAVPSATGCVARVAVGVQAGRERMLPMLVAGSHKALGEDIVIWENLATDVTPRYDGRDRAVIAFQEFRRGFGTAG